MVIGSARTGKEWRQTMNEVHGRWEEKTVGSIEENACIQDWQSARCSVCKRYLTTPYMYYFSHYDYCPNCGAKMDAEPKPHENT